MVYAITDYGVYEAETLEKLNKEMDMELNKEDFFFRGSDQVIVLSKEDIDFVQDRKQLTKIMFQNFFRKDPRPTLFFLIQVSLLAVNLLMAINNYNFLKNFIASIGG